MQSMQGGGAAKTRRDYYSDAIQVLPRTLAIAFTIASTIALTNLNLHPNPGLSPCHSMGVTELCAEANTKISWKHTKCPCCSVKGMVHSAEDRRPTSMHF